MKLLCEFKRDSARFDQITVGFSDLGLTGVPSDYKRWESDSPSVKCSLAAFANHVGETYGVRVVRHEVLRRLSARENIGAFMLVLDLNSKGAA